MIIEIEAASYAKYEAVLANKEMLKRKKEQLQFQRVTGRLLWLVYLVFMLFTTSSRLLLLLGLVGLVVILFNKERKTKKEIAEIDAFMRAVTVVRVTRNRSRSWAIHQSMRKMVKAWEGYISDDYHREMKR